MAKKYLAYINPEESITDKEYANCNVIFITGDMDHTIFHGIRLKTDIFKYYYYGTALEVVVLDEYKSILEVHDITVEDAKYFGVSLQNVLTLNQSTFDMLATNDFTYNLKVNKFYNYCKFTVENMYLTMQRLTGFVLRLYVINGTIVYIELDDNPKQSKQYALSGGYVVTDKSKLKYAAGLDNSTSVNWNEKLKQEDIDKLITRIIG